MLELKEKLINFTAITLLCTKNGITQDQVCPEIDREDFLAQSEKSQPNIKDDDFEEVLINLASRHMKSLYEELIKFNSK